jgi:hypothetical protein
MIQLFKKTGGNVGMAKAMPGLQVVASANEAGVPAVTKTLRDSETIKLGYVAVPVMALLVLLYTNFLLLWQF